MDKEQIEARIAELEQARAKLISQLQASNGMILENRNWLRKLTEGDENPAKPGKQVKKEPTNG